MEHYILKQKMEIIVVETHLKQKFQILHLQTLHLRIIKVIFIL